MKPIENSLTTKLAQRYFLDPCNCDAGRGVSVPLVWVGMLSHLKVLPSRDGLDCKSKLRSVDYLRLVKKLLSREGTNEFIQFGLMAAGYEFTGLRYFSPSADDIPKSQ